MVGGVAGRGPVVCCALTAYRRSVRLLERASIPEPHLSAAYLLSAAMGLGCDHAQHTNRFDPLHPSARQQPLSPAARARYVALLRRRLSREPVQYIVGSWDFRDLTLAVRSPCLIPRPETEELVELVLKDFGAAPPPTFLEVGCGSGAVSIALLREWPDARAVAIDTAAECVELTRDNAELHGVTDRLDVLHACVSAPEVLKAAPSRGFDLIVSNPPYIKTCEWRVLQPDVRIWESREALDGGEDGLDVVRMILSSSFPTEMPGVHGSSQVGLNSERMLTRPTETYAANRSEDGVQGRCSILRARGGAIWMELDVNQPIYLQEQMQNAAGVGAWWSAPENECEPIRTYGKGGVEKLEVEAVFEDFTGRTRFCKLTKGCNGTN